MSTESLITVGDSAANGYRLVGLPDGLGAFDNGNGTITVVMNHELGATKGVVRAHGSKGSFVSRWIIRKSDHKVLSGSDLIQRIIFLTDFLRGYDEKVIGLTGAQWMSVALIPTGLWILIKVRRSLAREGYDPPPATLDTSESYTDTSSESTIG